MCDFKFGIVEWLNLITCLLMYLDWGLPLNLSMSAKNSFPTFVFTAIFHGGLKYKFFLFFTFFFLGFCLGSNLVFTQIVIWLLLLFKGYGFVGWRTLDVMYWTSQFFYSLNTVSSTVNNQSRGNSRGKTQIYGPFGSWAVMASSWLHQPFKSTC